MRSIVKALLHLPRRRPSEVLKWERVVLAADLDAVVKGYLKGCQADLTSAQGAAQNQGLLDRPLFGWVNGRWHQ